MAQPPDEHPPRTALDEAAARREIEHDKEIFDYLENRRAFLESPNYPGHANDNSRRPSVPTAAKPSPKIDALLDQLVAEPKPKRETLLDRSRDENSQRPHLNEVTAARQEPQPAIDTSQLPDPKAEADLVLAEIWSVSLEEATRRADAEETRSACERETLLEKLEREAEERGEKLKVELSPSPERVLERKLEKNKDRW